MLSEGDYALARIAVELQLRSEVKTTSQVDNNVDSARRFYVRMGLPKQIPPVFRKEMELPLSYNGDYLRGNGKVTH